MASPDSGGGSIDNRGEQQAFVSNDLMQNGLSSNRNLILNTADQDGGYEKIWRTVGQDGSYEKYGRLLVKMAVYHGSSCL